MILLDEISLADYTQLFRTIGFNIVRESLQYPSLGRMYLVRPKEWSCNLLLFSEVMFDLILFEY